MQLEPERLSFNAFEIQPKKQTLRFRHIKSAATGDNILFSIDKPLYRKEANNKHIFSEDSLDFSALGWVKAVAELPNTDSYFQI